MSDGRDPRREEPADATVVERCRRGEVELFRVLVERYQDRVYNLSLRPTKVQTPRREHHGQAALSPRQIM